MADATFPCLGIQALGQCAYEPAKPFSIYFSLGEVIGALVFTLAVAELLKPIHRFRLRARFLSLRRLYVCVFVGVLFVLIGAIVPHFTILHGSLWGYAIFWEVMAAMCFIFAYGAVALAVVLPVKVRAHGVAKFAQSGADLLSRASETDHVEFAEDLRQSMPMLVRAAQFVERLHYPSAFFMFTHRQRIAQGAYARSFLLILADPAFCATAVRKIPWQAARTLKDLAKGELHARSAEEFVRQLAQQAIINDDGMMEREIGYHGFAAAPLLSEALFSDPFIVSVYDPYELISLAQDDFSGRQLKRLNSAIERSYEALLEKRFGDARTTHSIRRTYELVFSQVWRYRKSGSENYGFPLEMHSAVKQTINAAHSLLKATGDREYAYLFVKNEKDHRHDMLEDFVDIVYEAMLAISNDFEGPGDSFWMIAIGSVGHVFPSIGDAPDGLNPFQQRLLVKMKKKISDNMQGYYPALARMLLAAIGPYTRKARQKNRTAANILLDVFYLELLDLSRTQSEGAREAAGLSASECHL